MIRRRREEIDWLEFELFQEFTRLKHGVFLRHGGISQGSYSSLNVSFGLGDEVEAVEENRSRILSVLQIPSLTWAKQVHGHDLGLVGPAWDARFPCDGLLTKDKNTALMVQHADCQAAIFYDPIHHAAANIHCGWRGSVQNIYAHAVNAMKMTFDSKPQDLHVGISPSLGPSKAEFIHYRKELPESFWEFQVKPNYFDFWAISEWQLLECGLLPHHIQIAKICTYENPNDYYSHRFSMVRGGHGTLVALT